MSYEQYPPSHWSEDYKKFYDLRLEYARMVLEYHELNEKHGPWTHFIPLSIIEQDVAALVTKRAELLRQKPKWAAQDLGLKMKRVYTLPDGTEHVEEVT